MGNFVNHNFIDTNQNNEFFKKNWLICEPKEYYNNGKLKYITHKKNIEDKKKYFYHDWDEFNKGKPFKIVIKNFDIDENFKEVIFLNENQERHRAEKPAYFSYDINERLRIIKYYKNGKQHRDNGPAELHWDNDRITFLKYYKNGKLHRDDGPAFINCWTEIINNHKQLDNTKIIFYRDGLIHRDFKPAFYFYSNDILRDVEYYENGKLHRDDDLPAIIKYDDYGKIINEEYFLDGVGQI